MGGDTHLKFNHFDIERLVLNRVKILLSPTLLGGGLSPRKVSILCLPLSASSLTGKGMYLEDAEL